MTRARVAAVGLAALACATGAQAAAAPTHGRAVIGGASVPVRYAAAFVRTPAHGAFGGYGIVLAASPLPCDRLAHLPDENRLGARWVLLALNPTKDGFAQTGEVRGEVAYPVGDAYASLSRGVTINL